MEQKSLLKYLRVAVTTKCDKKCWYCFAEGIYEKKEEMKDVESFLWFVDFLKTNFGTTNIRFTGGEPLLNPELEKMVKGVAELGIKNIGITTNGYMLKQNYNKLVNAGVGNLAIHLTDIDNKNWRINELNLPVLSKRVRYNIVVTKENYERVCEFLKYANKKHINLLLLDLIENETMLESVRKEQYIDFSEIEKYLLKADYKEYVQNENCIVYNNGNHDIKITKRYDMVTGKKYCTKHLSMHPLLLTSDFNFKLCNHFGKKEIYTRELILSRNQGMLLSKVNEILEELHTCDSCNGGIELRDCI